MVFLVTLLPVFFIPVLWISTMQAKMVLIIALLIIATTAWVVARFIEGSVRLPKSLILAAGLLIPVAYVLSVAFSGAAQKSLVGNGVEQDTLAFTLILYAGLVLSALIFSGARGAGIKALQGLSIGVFFLMCIQVVHIAIPDLSLGGVIATAAGNAFGTWHEFAILLGFFIVLGLGIRNTGVAAGWRRYALYAMCILSAAFLVVANFFDVWLVVFLAGAIALVSELRSSHAHLGWSSFSWKSHGIWTSVVLLALFSIVFGTFINSVLPSRIHVVNVEVRPSWSGTMQIGESALTRPASLFFGVGPNTFGREWSLYRPLGVNQTVFWDADFATGVGSIPTSFITTGIFGILAWLSFVAALFWNATRSLVRLKGDAPDVLYTAALGLSSVYLVVFYVFYVPGPALSLLMFLFIGLFVAFSVHAGSVGTFYAVLRENTLRSSGLVMCLALFGVGMISAFVGVSRVLAADILLNRSVVTYRQTQDVQAASALVDDALRINPHNARAHRTAVQLGLVLLDKLSAQSDANSEEARARLQSTLEVTIQHGLSAVRSNEDDYQNWLQLAGLYQQLAGVKVAGAYDEARAAYERAREQNPSSPVPLFQLAQLELLENHQDAALEALEQAVQLKPDIAAAYYLASQIYAAQNDLKSAFASAALATQYAPEDARAWYNSGAISYAAADYANAISALEKTLVLEPNNANGAYLLGLSYYQSGRAGDSLRMFEALDRLDPGQAIVTKAIEDLRAGRNPVAAPADTRAPAK